MNLPAVPYQPPDSLWAADEQMAVAVSGWTGDRAIVIGDDNNKEWLTFDGEVSEVLDER